MPTSKTKVVEAIFNARFIPPNQLTNPIVTLDDIHQAIISYNAVHPNDKISPRNPANFFKDLIRGKSSANNNWPASVFRAGYTGRQLTGESRSFEFIPIPSGQLQAFRIHNPSTNTVTHRIESVSMPIASRLLARSDEAWLFQTAVKLRLVETHLALMSPHDIVQVDHLMMAVKLHKTEIDAIFLAHEGPVTRPQPILVTCEVKGKRDDILEDQIISQTEAASKIINIGHKYIIPIAMKAVGLSEIYVVEFEKVHISSAATLTSLIVSSEATYKLIPTVPGIGK